MADKTAKRPPRPRAARVKPSTINEIVRQNALQIRQADIDADWDARAVLTMTLAGQRVRPPSRRSQADKRAIEETIRRLVAEEVGGDAHVEGDPLPPARENKAAFAARTGISANRWDELENGIVHFTVEELVSIAAHGNVDVAYMLLPCYAAQELEAPLRLGKAVPAAPEVSFWRWALFARGLMPLAGNAYADFFDKTSIPSNCVLTVDGRKNRQAAPKGIIGDREQDLSARKESLVSAHREVRRSDLSDFSPAPLAPPSDLPPDWSGADVIRSAAALLTHLRIAIAEGRQSKPKVRVLNARGALAIQEIANIVRQTHRL